MPYGSALIKGLGFTFRLMLRKPITVQYPTERDVLAPRTRAEPHLRRWPDGTLKCVACKLCARACPDCLIDIDTTKTEEGPQIIDAWRWESQACMFCGLCADACPWDALELSANYELASYTSDALWRTLSAGETADTIKHHKEVAAELEAAAGGPETSAAEPPLSEGTFQGAPSAGKEGHPA